MFCDAGHAVCRNPVPRIDWGGGGGSNYGGSCRGHGRGANCLNFKPPCDDSWLDTHRIDSGGATDDVEGECSGDWTGGQIVDEVLIPMSLKPGPYVVGWRWDVRASLALLSCSLPRSLARHSPLPLSNGHLSLQCEETTQIWESCADVLIV